VVESVKEKRLKKSFWSRWVIKTGRERGGPQKGRVGLERQLWDRSYYGEDSRKSQEEPIKKQAPGKKGYEGQNHRREVGQHARDKSQVVICRAGAGKTSKEKVSKKKATW